MLKNLLDFFLKDNRINRINVFCREAYYSPQPRVKYFALNKFSRFQKGWQLFKNKFTFWGGGTCFFESEGNNGIFELLRMQKIASFNRRKFAFLGIGIGELNSPRYISTSQQLMKNSFLCYFRDLESLTKAERLIEDKEFCLGGDLAFLSDIKPVSVSADLKKISFSGHYNFKKYPLKSVADILNDLIAKLNCKIYFLPAHTGISFNDNIYHEQLTAHLNPKSYEICDWNTPEEYIRIMQEMDFHIGIRLHSLIIADLLGIPNCGIAYSPKITYYLNKTQILPYLRNVEPDSLDLVENILNIKQQYKYPEKFIKSERKSALSCLEQIFSYV